MSLSLNFFFSKVGVMIFTMAEGLGLSSGFESSLTIPGSGVVAQLVEHLRSI